jgi:hypothetical protein
MKEQLTRGEQQSAPTVLKNYNELLTQELPKLQDMQKEI